MSIPAFDPVGEYHRLRAEVDAAIAGVLESGQLILGPQVAAFEAEFAAYCEVPEAVGVASGTDAIYLALRALGIGSGDEVITTPMTATFTALAITMAGATPIFADIEPDTALIDPAAIARAITAHTRAIVPVHLYGQPCAMDEILAVAEAHDLVVIEDACQAHGARYKGERVGRIGHAGCFSFYPTKNLGALGDGGALVTSDPDLAARVRRLRNGGRASSYEHQEAGVNSRLDELQAAILRVKLAHLDAFNQRRRELAGRYRELGGDLGVRFLREAVETEPVYHLLAVRSNQRDALQAWLAGRGVTTGIHYPIPVHLQPAYASLGHRSGTFPHAERHAAEVLSLPLYPTLRETDLEAVVDATRAFRG